MSFVSLRTTGLVIIVAGSYWWAVFLAMHVLEPEFNPLKAPGSAYVLGAYGAWMTTTYFAMSAVLLSAALGLVTTVPATRMTRVAFSAFLLAGAGTVLAGLFPMDFPGPPHTSSGRLHALGGLLTFPSWVVGTLLFSLSIRRADGWRRHSTTLLALSASSLAMTAVLVVSVMVAGFGGYAQRVVIALLAAWLFVVAQHLMRRPQARDLSRA